MESSAIQGAIAPRSSQAARTQSAFNPLNTGTGLCSIACQGSSHIREKRSNSNRMAGCASAPSDTSAQEMTANTEGKTICVGPLEIEAVGIPVP